MSFSFSGRRQRAPRRSRKQSQLNSNHARRSHLEQLEPRHMLSISLDALPNIQVPGGQSVLVPLTGVDSGGGPITYTFQTSDSSAPVTLSLVSTTSPSLQLDVSGTDNNGQAFSGTLIIHLFEDLAATATAQLENIVNNTQLYNGSDFFRVLDGFVAQNNSASSGTKFGNQIVDQMRFVSPGLLSFSNGGPSKPNTNDSQFFITAIDRAGTTDPITLAREPQLLSGNFTIVGQLVSGFDTFEKIMSTNVQASPTFTNPDGSPEVSQPTHEIKINSAAIINDTQDAVLRVSSTDASFVNNGLQITVTATNSANESTTQTFDADVVINPPTLEPVSNQTTAENTPVSFNLTSHTFDLTNNQFDTNASVDYIVVDPNTFADPANVTVSVDQATGKVTLTPVAGFLGTINLLAGVRADAADSDVQANYDTLPFTLTVKFPAPTVDPTSNTGPFDGNGYITTNTPKLTITAVTGATVQFKLNGIAIATGTETSAGSGVYTATVPAGKLAVGANSITATVTDGTSGDSNDSIALSLIYAPNYNSGVYVVPGAPGTSQTLSLAWTSKKAGYDNELGYFIADSADGSIGDIAPGQAGYAQAALSSSTRVVLFSKGQSAGANATATLQAGQLVVFYLIQNNTTANFLAKNPSNTPNGNNKANAPLAFFSIQAANPDGSNHTQIIADPTTGRVQYNWEDLIALGDSDFNDAAIVVKLASQSTTSGTPTLHAPGTGSTTVNVTGTLGAGKKNSAPGDIGVFFVDSPDGTIGSTTPGSSGYAAAALGTGNFQVLFGAGAAAGATQQISVPAGKYLAFYTITSGSTSNFLSVNPTDSSSGGPVALFSFDAANPNGIDHFRWTSPESVKVDPSQTELHIMDQIFGGDSNFDDLTVDLSFSA